LLKYNKCWSDALPHGKGWIYQEVDWEADLIVRQIEVCGEKHRWGIWTGSALEGAICDQSPSVLDYADTEDISPTEFESVWNQARQSNATGW